MHYSYLLSQAKNKLVALLAGYYLLTIVAYSVAAVCLTMFVLPGAVTRLFFEAIKDRKSVERCANHFWHICRHGFDVCIASDWGMVIFNIGGLLVITACQLVYRGSLFIPPL